MEQTVGESMARRLVAWDVDTVFGLPGDGINGLMEGFRRVQDELKFVLVHHEEAAAFMATGYAKATGRLGHNEYGQILWEQMILGYPEYAVRHRKPEPDFGAWAKACGGFGVKVTEPAEVEGAVRDLLAHPGPGIVDCSVNPNEPPMPGKITYDQAKHFTEAFLRGQPHKMATLAAVARDKINELRS